MKLTRAKHVIDIDFCKPYSGTYAEKVYGIMRNLTDVSKQIVYVHIEYNSDYDKKKGD